MSKQTERENYLLTLLNTTNRISTREAVEILGVSDATARRIFANMEKSGKIIRDYGGIQLARRTMNYSFEESEQVFKLEKQRIGRLAASFINNGDTIYLDCGTTVFQMTLAINELLASGELKALNIITNSIANVQTIVPSSSCHVVLVGGEYNRKRRDFSGPLTEKYVAPFHFTKSFFGCDGLSAGMGFSSNQIDISSLNTVVMERTEHSFALLDNSKFEKCSLMTYAQLSDIEAIVTNMAPPAVLQKALSDAHVSIHLAGKTVN